MSSIPPAELLERAENIDILFIPVGKGYLETKAAVKLVKQIRPRIVIPYPIKQTSSFLDEMGQKCETEDRLTLKKKDVLDMGDKTKIVCLRA